MTIDWKLTTTKLYCALELSRRAVGVKLIKTREEYEAIEAICLTHAPINYCQMVAAATRGNRIKACSENFNCRSGARVLGIDPADPKNGHGENWARLDLYHGEDLCRKIRAGLSYSTELQYGVLLAPLEQMDVCPDVVLLAVNPYNAMRIIQGYAYHYGMPQNINMIGNQAICLECSARPYVIKDMNVSMLCIGTRHRAGWKEDELAIGIPIEQFELVVDGLLHTLNQMENDANKSHIDAKFKEQNIDFPIRFGWNYYKDC